MNQVVAAAIAALQERAAWLQYTNAYMCERYELAINELILHPNRIGDPKVLARRALANARIHQRNRAEIVQQTCIDVHDEANAASLPAHCDSQFAVADVNHFIEHIMLAASDRVIISSLADGTEVADLAVIFGIPLATMKVRVSRARARARQLWEGA